MVQRARQVLESRRNWDQLCIEMRNRQISTHPNDGVGPYIEKKVLGWLEHTPTISEIPPPFEGNSSHCRKPAPHCKSEPKWSEDLRGDLQRHSTWSDGSGAVPEIAAAAEERGTNMPRSQIIRLRIAKAAGVHTSLGTDADGPAKLRFMESTALLAGIEPARIFNHISNEDLLGWVDSLRWKSSKSGVPGADSESTRPRKRKLPSIRT
jgi:hypothetical protein